MLPVPTLIKPDGRRLVAQSPLDQLLDRREDCQRQLDALDAQIREMKQQRRTVLLEELRSLGFDKEAQAKPRKKYVMTEAHKRALAASHRHKKATAAPPPTDDAVREDSQ